MFIFSLLPHLLGRSSKAKCVAVKTKNNSINNIGLRRCAGMIAIVFTLISFSSMAQTWSHLIEGTYGGKLLKNSQGDMLLTGEARYPIMSEMAINQVEHPVYDYVYQLTAKPDILWGKSFSDENEALAGLVSGHFIIEKNDGEYALFLEGHHVSEQTVAFFSHSGDLLAWHSLAGEYQFNQGIGTHDGGMLMVGATQAGQGLVVKMDHKGMVEWQHVMSQGVTVLTHVVQLKSGDFMMIGQSLRDSDQTIATLIRLSRLGEEHWVVHLSGDEAEHTQLSGLALTHNEDVIIAGTRSETAYSNLSQGWIARVKIGKKSKQVKLVWETLAGKADAQNQINDIVVTSNAIVAVGASNQKSNQSYMDYWVLGVTLKGNTEWEHHYGGIIGNDEAFSVIEMNEAQLLVSGYSSGFAPLTGTWLLSLNAAGEIDDFTPTVLQH